jgi:hypothetical protein
MTAAIGGGVNDGKAMRWKARIGDMEIGHLNGYRSLRGTHPYLVYVTNSKHWSPAVRAKRGARNINQALIKRQ